MQFRSVGIDIGHSSIKVVELAKSGPTITLMKCDVVDLDIDPDDKSVVRERVVIDAIRIILEEKNIKPEKTVLVISNQAVFSRFVKLPLVGQTKLDQIIGYEAQQQIPFPMDEIVWDYQITGRDSGDTDENSVDVLIVAIKSDLVNQLLNYTEAIKINVDVIDVASLALYNNLFYNGYIGRECIGVLTIGAKTSTLIIVDSTRLWTRAIPIAGDTITEMIKKEMEVSFRDAESLKIAHAALTPGGGGKDRKERVAAIAAEVFEKLQAEVIRSIGYYRTQFGGNKITKLLLSGGSCEFAGIEAFFHAKLGVEVALLDSLRNIEVSEGLKYYDLPSVKHLFGETVGGALRKLIDCPKQINLLPKNIAAYNIFTSSKMHALAGLAATLCAAALFYVFDKPLFSAFESMTKENSGYVEEVNTYRSRYMTAQREAAALRAKLDAVIQAVDLKYLWPDILAALARSMPDNLWIETITSSSDPSVLPGGANDFSQGQETQTSRRAVFRGIQPRSSNERTPYDPVLSVIITGKCLAEGYRSLDIFKENLKKEALFDKTTVEIMYAKPPDKGLVEFGICIALAEQT